MPRFMIRQCNKDAGLSLGLEIIIFFRRVTAFSHSAIHLSIKMLVAGLDSQ